MAGRHWVAVAHLLMMMCVTAGECRTNGDGNVENKRSSCSIPNANHCQGDWRFSENRTSDICCEVLQGPWRKNSKVILAGPWNGNQVNGDVNSIKRWCCPTEKSEHVNVEATCTIPNANHCQNGRTFSDKFTSTACCEILAGPWNGNQAHGNRNSIKRWCCPTEKSEHVNVEATCTIPNANHCQNGRTFSDKFTSTACCEILAGPWNGNQAHGNRNSIKRWCCPTEKSESLRSCLSDWVVLDYGKHQAPRPSDMCKHFNNGTWGPNGPSNSLLRWCCPSSVLMRNPNNTQSNSQISRGNTSPISPSGCSIPTNNHCQNGKVVSSNRTSDSCCFVRQTSGWCCPRPPAAPRHGCQSGWIVLNHNSGKRYAASCYEFRNSSRIQENPSWCCPPQVMNALGGGRNINSGNNNNNSNNNNGNHSSNNGNNKNNSNSNNSVIGSSRDSGEGNKTAQRCQSGLMVPDEIVLGSGWEIINRCHSLTQNGKLFWCCPRQGTNASNRGQNNNNGNNINNNNNSDNSNDNANSSNGNNSNGNNSNRNNSNGNNGNNNNNNGNSSNYGNNGNFVNNNNRGNRNDNGGRKYSYGYWYGN